MNSSILGERLAQIKNDLARLSWDKEHPAKLVAVTKTVDAATCNLLAEYKHFDIGENRVQVIQEKLPHLLKDFNIHFIGRLQTNKIRYIIESVSLFHSLDRVHLAEELNAQAMKKSLVKDVLLQVNIAKEQQKAGFELNELAAFLQNVKDYKGLQVRGLMAIMPYIEDERELAGYFKAMRQLFDRIKEQAPQAVRMEILSMGMTHDYKIALSEGANMVRIGSALFSE